MFRRLLNELLEAYADLIIYSDVFELRKRVKVYTDTLEKLFDWLKKKGVDGDK